MRDYLQHGRRHGPNGTDPIPGLSSGIQNDWCYSTAALNGTGTVPDSTPVTASMTSLNYQTDDGSVYGIEAGTPSAVSILQVGTYLIRARAHFPNGRTSGTVKVSAVISGPVTTHDYFTAAGLIGFVSALPGEAIWEQLCVVNDLSSTTGAYVDFEQTTGTSMVGCIGEIQIFRFT